jgi:phosphatidylglycerophosphate synthase
MSGATPPPGGLAFKAREIEEFVDVYFFRRVGIVFARLARELRLTPTAVTVGAIAAGVTGGLLLASPRYAMLGIALLILHGVLDSSDGQLARLTGQATDFGRVMDGIAGYATHTAMYCGIILAAFPRYGWSIVALAAAAGLCTVVHAQMYDYHRTTYAAFAIKGEVPGSSAGRQHRGVLGLYESMQRALAGEHPVVERRIARRATGGSVASDDRDLYRACFYRPVRGWNLMGDNVRRLSIAVAAWVGRPEWFVWAELIPLNVLFVLLWWTQRRADQRFLGHA